MSEPRTLVLYHSENWENPVVHLRVRAPAAAAGWQVVAGNAWAAGQLTECRPEAVDQADAVLIQREFPRFTAAFDAVLARARAAGKPVLYELDDLLLELPRDHPGWRYHARSRPALLRAVLAADAVLVSTAPLADYLRPFNPNVRVWPNCWDAALWPLVPPAVGDPAAPVVIGYVGTHTHGPDVAQIGPVLRRVLERHAGRVRVRFLGGTPPPPEVAGRPDVAWEQFARLDYADYARALRTEQLDIALAPLRDEPFNRCKSAIKYLEYSALGAAGVYSRLPPYAAVVASGQTGWLASAPADWEAALEALITQPEQRLSLAAAAQADLQARWRLTDRAAEWAAGLTATATRAAPAAGEEALRRVEHWTAEVTADLDEQLAQAQTAPAARTGWLGRLRRLGRRGP